MNLELDFLYFCRVKQLMYFACIPKKTFKSKVSKISVQGTFNMAMNVCEHDVNDIETTTNRTQINNLIAKVKTTNFTFKIYYHKNLFFQIVL